MFLTFVQIFWSFGSQLLVNFSSFRAILGAIFSYLVFLIACSGCTVKVTFEIFLNSGIVHRVSYVQLDCLMLFQEESLYPISF